MSGETITKIPVGEHITVLVGMLPDENAPDMFCLMGVILNRGIPVAGFGTKMEFEDKGKIYPNSFTREMAIERGHHMAKLLATYAEANSEVLEMMRVANLQNVLTEIVGQLMEGNTTHLIPEPPKTHKRRTDD